RRGESSAGRAWRRGLGERSGYPSASRVHPPTELDPTPLGVDAPRREADRPIAPDVDARPRVDSLGTALAVALGTTAVVTAISWLAPTRHAATLVGLAFLAATWWRVLRHDEATIRHHGLSLGGVLEPVRIDA